MLLFVLVILDNNFRCHISVLCIGMELIGVSNYALAEQYLEEAKNLCPYDPAVYNEIAVLAYKNAEYVVFFRLL